MNIEEAIETLKNALKCNKKQFEELGTHILLQEDEQEAIETLLTAYEKEKEKNKITKQMNENLIEALKESTSNDKIKAKIEPVLKQLEREMEEEYNKYGNSREYQDIVDAYNFLQSLLEKE